MTERKRALLDRQYGHRPDWTPGRQVVRTTGWKQPEEMIGTVSGRDRFWLEKLIEWEDEMDSRLKIPPKQTMYDGPTQ